MGMQNLLRSERLFLGLVERKDLPQRVVWINDPEIQKTLNYDYPTSLARTEKWFDKVVMDPSRRDFSIFALETSECIGFCSLYNIDWLAKKAELSNVIGNRSYWGKGYGSESYRLLVNYGFLELGLNKIYGYQLVHNHAAHRAVEKLGWSRDGLLRQDLYSHGKVSDRYVVSILREEWEKLEIYKST
jgi:RimJ/RimL family protein N-acetyltransferase